MHKRTLRSRAAGVSPPWLGKRLPATPIPLVRGHSSRAGARSGGRQPAVGVCLQIPQALPCQPAGRPPARCVLGNRRCIRVNRLPRGAYAPRSCVGVRTSAGEKTIFAMHKRTSGSGAAGVSPPWLGHTIGVPREANVVQRRANTQPGAAGVSPPWVWVTHLQGRFRKVRRCKRARSEDRRRCMCGSPLHSR
jgi:hypothetical protein